MSEQIEAPEPVAVPAAPEARRSRTPLVVGVVVALVVVVIAAVGVVMWQQHQRKQQLFADALATCGLSDRIAFRVSDGGMTMTMDGRGNDDGAGAASVVEEACVLGALNAPSRVTTLMGETRALDGRQTATWDGITASWSYHPDNGLDVIFTQA